MKLLRCLAVMCFLLGTCYAQLPEYYQTINRVSWLSGNIDGILPAWTALGMTDIRKPAKRGKSIRRAWRRNEFLLPTLRAALSSANIELLYYATNNLLADSEFLPNLSVAQVWPT